MGTLSEKTLSEQIKKIYDSPNLSDVEKDRLISAMLTQTAQPNTGRELRPVKGYISSILFPPLGLFIGIHYILRYEEDGLKPGIICIILTCASFAIQLMLFKKILHGFFAGFSSTLQNLQNQGMQLP